MLLQVPLADEPFEDGPRWTVWRGDGRIATGYYTCGDEGEEFAPASTPAPRDQCEDWFVVDPEARTSERLEWSTAVTPAWWHTGGSHRKKNQLTE